MQEAYWPLWTSSHRDGPLRLKIRDSRALRWLLAETVGIFTLNTVAVASEALRSSPDVLVSKLGERFSAGLASAHVMRQIAKDVDKYLRRALTSR